MLNTTTRSAVSIWNLPPWEFSWTDTSPQKARRELSVDDIIPGPQDGQQFFDRAVVYTMRLLVEVFPCLAGLAEFLPAMDASSPILKSTVIPQEVLFRDEKYIDEKYIDENIHILRQYIHDCKFTGRPQVHLLYE
jgi:hypothetical protein